MEESLISEVLNGQDAAAALGVHYRTLFEILKRGDLRCLCLTGLQGCHSRGPGVFLLRKEVADYRVKKAREVRYCACGAPRHPGQSRRQCKECLKKGRARIKARKERSEEHTSELQSRGHL